LAAVVSAGSAAFAFQQTEDPIIIQPNVQRPAEQRTTLTGEFASQHEGTITVTREGETPRTFQTTEETQILINGRPGRLEDLSKGEQIRITEGPGGVVTRIEAQRRPGERPGEDFEASDQETENLQPRTLQRESGQREDAIERRGAGFRGPGDEGNLGQDANRRDRVDSERRGTQAGTAWLGVILREVEGQGVQVARTYPSGPASRAGLYSGDVLREIDGKNITSPEDAYRIIEQAQPSDEIQLVVQRGDERQKLTAVLGDRRVFLGEDPEPVPQPQERGDNFEDFDDDLISEHAMMLEQHRRFAEQHQRMEEKLDRVLEELEELRRQLGQNRPAAQQPNVPRRVE
jgi:hypothetical protein